MKLTSRLKEDIKKYILQRQKAQRDKVKIIAAYKLSQDEIDSLKKSFASFISSEPEVVIDPQILAGVILRKGSKVIDLSLTGKINKLQNVLHEIA
ncbi:MAG: F0F1 ATP synthase subunit delta [Patescibacteria group bacterium]